MKDGKTVVGFLGLGNIGSAAYRLLAERCADTHVVKLALIRDMNKDRGGLPREILTKNADDVINDPEIDIVAEFLGGVEPAWEYMHRALEAGKVVVTANKAALAAKWPELESAAEKSGAGLYFEAACCAGMPIVRALKSSLQANDINKLMGIINGTTNFILSKMSEGLPYERALELAQKDGLAEPDPSADVGGFDAANKLSLLLSLALRTSVPLKDIFFEGIEGITERDVAYADGMGLCIKLLAIGKREGANIEARVHPTFIPKSHPLASVRDSYNAVYLTGHAVENMMFYGRGAGQYPTASAIVSDIINASSVSKGHHDSFKDEVTVQPQFIINKDWTSEYFVRVDSLDEPGVLARVANVFGSCGVSLARVNQTDYGTHFVPVVFLTHPAKESSMRRAVNMINSMLVGVGSVGCMIRVERDSDL